MNSDSYKDNIKRARDIALENCLDLGQIHAENPEFFVKHGVKLGLHVDLSATLNSGSRRGRTALVEDYKRCDVIAGCKNGANIYSPFVSECCRTKHD